MKKNKKGGQNEKSKPKNQQNQITKEVKTMMAREREEEKKGPNKTKPWKQSISL